MLIHTFSSNCTQISCRKLQGLMSSLFFAPPPPPLVKSKMVVPLKTKCFVLNVIGLYFKLKFTDGNFGI